MLAWAYILSARWAELIPGACISSSNKCQTSWDKSKSNLEEATHSSINVDIGEVSKDASQWWDAILSAEGGWDATLRNAKGHILHSPWSMKLNFAHKFVISATVTEENVNLGHLLSPISSRTAEQYLSEYCHLHDLTDQSEAAFAAALLIPVAKYDNRPIQLSIPTPKQNPNHRKQKGPTSLPRIRSQLQFDRLLAMSCNPRGVKALLDSIFFEPGIKSNTCGLWLRGSFSFLDTLNDPHALLRTLMKRDPDLGWLWLGAFITGTHTKCLREARLAWWKIDISAAAWTGTHMSFIQTPVSNESLVKGIISRADECRLLYLSQDLNHRNPPLFPFEPFGFTSLDDTNLDVREHALCGQEHRLEYSSFSWDCEGGKRVKQSKKEGTLRSLRPKNVGDANYEVAISVDSETLDEDEDSESITRNIFTWLRGEDGFPIAERDIRNHEWIDNLDSNDDSPITGDVCSTVGARLHRWLLKASTQSAYSI